MSKVKTAIIIAITAATAGAAAWAVRGHTFYAALGEDMSKAYTVSRVIREVSIYEPDKETMGDYAAIGMVAALNDPYSVYYSREDFQSYLNSGSGDFVGIGATIMVNTENELQIVEITEGTGSQEAGLVPGDIILAADGTPYSGDQFNEAISYVRGSAQGEDAIDTSVVLTVRRTDGTTADIEVFRRRTHTEAVKSRMIDDKTGYIRISRFNGTSKTNSRDTSDEFKEHLSQLTDQGMQQLVIDLRSNPGGNEQAVCKIADRLLPEGLIMAAEYKDGSRKETKSDAEALDMSMAVLVNGMSASASELLTGALKDYQKAVIVGERTYGKGVMQSIIPLKDGSGLVITSAKYYTPNGTCVQENGIEPDYPVSLPEELRSVSISDLDEAQDIQLNRAVEILNGGK